MKSPRILLITDVFGWGGHLRAQKIKEHLSNDFYFDIVDATQFHNFERNSDTSFAEWTMLEKIRSRGKWTKNFINIDEIKAILKQNQNKKRDYDLYYLMFHTMLCWQEVKRMMYTGSKFLSVVTGMPVVKEVFDSDKMFPNGETAFKTLAGKCVGIAANNMISLGDVKQLVDVPTWYIPRGVDTTVFKNKGYDIEKQFKCVFVGKAHSGKGLNRYIMPATSDSGIVMEVNERNYTNALTPEQMCNFYNKSHVYVVASVTDGTPNPALEAAACGRPIISNRIGNMPEFIKDGHNGFLVDRNIEAYKEKLKWLKNMPHKAKKMGENARQTVLDGWTWKHAMVRERAMLKEILS